MSEAKGKGGYLMDVVFGPVVKGASLLTAGGYISLRAHLNYLGISGPAYLGSERYLMEAYLFAVGLFEVLIWVAFPLLAVSLAKSALQRRLGASWTAFIWRIARVESIILPVIGLVFLVLLLALLLGMTGDADLIVGDLRNKAVPARSPYLYRIAVIAAALWWLLSTRMQGRPLLRLAMFGNLVGPALARTLIVAITLSYALTIPLIYGREVHPTTYPVARLAFRELPNKPICGIVVLHWADGLMLWQSAQGRGKIVSVSLDQARTVDWGPTRDVLAALQAANLPGDVPDCVSYFPG